MIENRWVITGAMYFQKPKRYLYMYTSIYLPSLRSVRWRPSLGLGPAESVSLSTLPPLCDSGAKNRKTGRQVIVIEQRGIQPKRSNNFTERVKITIGLGLSTDIGSKVNFVARNSWLRFLKNYLLLNPIWKTI